MQNEITKSSDLLDENGHLIQKGWARKLILDYNRENINAGWHRIKEWDYYCILHPDFGISLVIADVGYLGLCTVCWLDFKEKSFYCKDQMKLFTRGKLNLPRTSEEGDLHFSNKNIVMDFKRGKNKRILSVNYPDFMDGAGITGEIELYQDPKMDTIVVVTPFKENPKRFYYNQKINCMPAKGKIEIGGDSYQFSEDNCFGVLDWGRGVWTYKNQWYWGSASGLVKGKPIGWNIGYGFGDLSTHTENIIFYDGKGHKFDQVTFHIDPDDYLKPWRFTSNDGRFEMDFEPIFDRTNKMNLLILKTEPHQVFGYYNGHVVLDDGTKLHVDRLLGFAEEVFNKW